MRVGIDLDNTLISYDRVIYQLCREREWIDDSFPKNKRKIRDLIRQMPDGEEHWMSLQALIYVEKMDQAEIMPGAWRFLRGCLERDHSVWIISHKTRHAARDPQRRDMHRIALDFLQQRGLFSRESLGASFDKDQVIFNQTRDEKIDMIRRQKCDIFIDDLTEVLLHPEFPDATRKILFDPEGQSGWQDDLWVATSWDQIEEFVLYA